MKRSWEIAYMYKFYNEHISKGKMFTVNHFMSGKVPKRTIYNKTCWIDISAKPKLGSGRIAIKMNKRALKRFKKAIEHSDKLSQRQLARQFNIDQGFICKLLKKHPIKWTLGRKWTFQQGLNSKKKWKEHMVNVVIFTSKILIFHGS